MPEDVPALAKVDVLHFFDVNFVHRAAYIVVQNELVKFDHRLKVKEVASIDSDVCTELLVSAKVASPHQA